MPSPSRLHSEPSLLLGSPKGGDELDLLAAQLYLELITGLETQLGGVGPAQPAGLKTHVATSGGGSIRTNSTHPQREATLNVGQQRRRRS